MSKQSKPKVERANSERDRARRRLAIYAVLGLAALGLEIGGPFVREANLRQDLSDHAHMASPSFTPERIAVQFTALPEYSQNGGKYPRSFWRFVETKDWVLFNGTLEHTPAYCPELLPYVAELNKPTEGNVAQLRERLDYSIGQSREVWVYVPRFNAHPDRFAKCAEQGFGYDGSSGRLTYHGKAVALAWSSWVSGTVANSSGT